MAALPASFDLYADIVRVIRPGVAQGVTDGKVHCLNCKRSRAVYAPIEPDLAIASGVRARAARGVRDRYVGLGVNCIGRVLTPLSRRREHDLKRRGQTQRQRWLEVDEVRVP